VPEEESQAGNFTLAVILDLASRKCIGWERRSSIDRGKERE